MFLTRTRAALEECQGHIRQTGSEGSQVESFLAQHALVIMCGEMQQEIYSLVERQMAASGNPELGGFVTGASKRLLRSVLTGEISGFIGLFSVCAKERFTRELDDAVVLQYNSAVKDRHDVAHKAGVQVTLGELVKIVEHASRVLEAVRLALAERPVPLRELGPF